MNEDNKYCLNKVYGIILLTHLNYLLNIQWGVFNRRKYFCMYPLWYFLDIHMYIHLCSVARRFQGNIIICWRKNHISRQKLSQIQYLINNLLDLWCWASWTNCCGLCMVKTAKIIPNIIIIIKFKICSPLRPLGVSAIVFLVSVQSTAFVYAGPDYWSIKETIFHKCVCSLFTPPICLVKQANCEKVNIYVHMYVYNKFINKLY